MAFTVEQLNALRDAYAQGVLSVRWGDKAVQYDTRSEMRERIRELERELGLRSTGMQLRNIVVDTGH